MKRFKSFHLLATIAALLSFLLVSPGSEAKKRIRIKGASKSAASAQTPDERVTIVNSDTIVMFADGFSRRYSPQDISVFGYDKPATSDKESFFVKNGTDRPITAFSITIEYSGKDGKQLHKRTIESEYEIPAGETRRIDVKSWDTQKSYYYEKSRVSRRAAIPYSVKITPVSFMFRR